MITLNRLGHSDEPFQLNPDMIVTVESTPDTVITLATGAKVVVAETPDQVAPAVRRRDSRRSRTTRARGRLLRRAPQARGRLACRSTGQDLGIVGAGRCRT